MQLSRPMSIRLLETIFTKLSVEFLRKINDPFTNSRQLVHG